jgi:hypothetical protein
MKTTENRLQVLEAAIGEGHKGRLPMVVDDDTPPEEMARLRKRGREVLTFGEMVEACVEVDHADR